MPTNTKKKRSQRRQIVFFLLLALAVAFGLHRFAKWSVEKDLLRVTFEAPSGEQTQSFYLEIAATPNTRHQGLMYRKPGDLADNHGMIFVFPRQTIQSFWMKNTYIALDIIFVDSDYRVVGVLSDVPVLNNAPRQVPAASLMVVELLAGQSEKHGIKIGSRLKLHGPLPRGV